MHYDHSAAKAYCAQRALAWDEQGAALADMRAWDVNLTQEQFDAALRLYTDRVIFLFSPKNYGLGARLFLAFHFLFGSKVGN